MATISGRLVYDSNRTFDGNGAGMAGVPIVLQSPSGGKAVAVNTDGNGNYAFTDVPDGNYQVVEKADLTPKPSATGSASWGSATTQSTITTGGVTPLINADTNQPNRAVWNSGIKSGSNAIDGVGATTLNISVSGDNVSNQTTNDSRNIISNGPVIYTPLSIGDSANYTQNLLTSLGENGSFGTYPQGTPASKNEKSDPFPINDESNPAVRYTKYDRTVAEGYYAVQNARVAAASMWNMSGHTTGNEMDRFVLVNNENAGRPILSKTVTEGVAPNTRYLLSGWFANVTKTPRMSTPPKFRMTAISNNNDGSTTELFNSDAPTMTMRTDMPEWRQFGDFIQTGPNTQSVTIKLVSTSSEWYGNDFTIDDIGLWSVPNAKADVRTEKTSDKANYSPGDPITYTITVINDGPSAAKAPIVTDAVPAGVENAQYSIDGGPSAPWPGSTTLADIPNGQRKVITITGKIAANATGSLSNTATTRTPTPNKNGGENVSSATADAAIKVSTDFTITKTSNKLEYLRGEDITFTITATNTGKVQAQAVSIWDDIPSYILNPKYTTNKDATQKDWTGRVDFGNLDPGQSVTATITGKVGPTAPGILRNNGAVTSSTPNQEGKQTYVVTDTSKQPGGDPKVIDTANLVIAKTSSATTVRNGESFTYTITVNNNGPSAAKAPVVADSVPQAVENPRYSLDNGVTWSAWPGSVALPDMPNGTVATILIRGNIAAGATGSFNNTATVNSPTLNPNPGTTTAKTPDTAILPPPPPPAVAKLTLTKKADKVTALPGETVTFVISAINGGPAVVKTPTITDSVPAVVEQTQYSVDNGATWAAWPGSLVLPDLAVNSTAMIMIKGQIRPGATGSIINSAAVATPTQTTPDSVPNGTAKIDIIDTADVKTEKTADKAAYLPGDPITYTVTVTNNGPAAAKTPTVSDTLPSSVQSAQFSVDGGAPAPWSGSTTLANIPAGAKRVVTISGRVSATSTGNLNNTVTVRTQTPNKTGGENVTTATTTPNVSDTADVKTEKTSDKTSSLPGEPITYTITITNNGPAAAKTPTVSDTLPSSVQSAQFSVDGGAAQPWSGSTTLADIPAGAKRVVTITGKVSATSTGNLNNTVTVRTQTPNKTGGENVTTATTTPSVSDTADVKTEKTSDKTSYLPGEPITYTITITNNGPAAAKTPTVSDTLPSSVQSAQFSVDGGAPAIWFGSTTLPDIPVGQKKVIVITGKVSANATGSLTNTATTKTPTPNKTGGDNTTTATTAPRVIDTADVRMEKTSDKPVAKPGEVITYIINIINAGPAAAKTPTLTDQISEKIDHPQFSTDGGATWSPWIGSATLADIPAGQKSVIAITGRVNANATGSLLNTATTRTPTPNKTGGENITTATTDPSVIDMADVRTEKTSDKTSYLPGDPITYTITVTNNGPASAKAPTVSDTLPSNVQGAQFSVDGGAPAPWPGNTTLADIPAGHGKVITITGRVNADASGSLRNTATTRTATPNRTGGENVTTATTDPRVIDTAEVKIEKTSDKSIVKPGEQLTYIINVINGGRPTARTPTVTDQIPALIESPQFSVNRGATWMPWTGSVAMPDLAAQSSTFLIIKGALSKTATGSITNTAAVTTLTVGKNGLDTPKTSTPVITDITPTSDLSTAVTPSNPNPKPGDTLIYTVTVRNNGPSASPPPTISYTPSSQLTKVEASKDGGETWTPWTGTATLSDMPGGGSVTALIRGVIAPDITGSITATMTVTGTNDDPVPANNQATAVTPIMDVALVSSTKAADKLDAKPGEPLAYTITVINAGPATAKTPTVKDSLHNAIENPEFSLNGGATWQPWTGSASLPDLAAHSKAVLMVRGVISASTPPGALNNTATITTPTPGIDGKNTPVISTPAVTNIIPLANLVTTMTPDRDRPKPGDELIYTITVKNNGPATAQTPNIALPPPRGLTDLQVSKDGGKTWTPWTGNTTIPDLPINETIGLLIKGKVTGETALISGNVTTTSVTDPNTGRVGRDTAVADTADITVAKTPDKASARPGETVTYTLIVTNNGPATAITPTVTDAIPAALTSVQFSGDNGATWQAWAGSQSLPDIPARSNVRLLIRGTLIPSAAGSVVNTAVVRTTTPWLDGTNPPFSATSTPTNVIPVADLAISATVNNGNPRPGETVTYTVIVKNNGPSTSAAPIVSYAPPPQLTSAEVSKDGGGTWAPWTGASALNDIPDSGTGQMLIRGRIDPRTTGGVSSSFTVSSRTEDPLQTNNAVSIVTPVMDVANLSPVKAVDKADALPGEALIYTITVTNSGPAAAKAPTITDQMPAMLESPEVSGDNGATWQAWTGSRALSDIPSGSSAKLLIRGTLSKSAAGSVVNTASAATTTPRPDGTNTPVTTPPVITSITPTADLMTAITVDNQAPRHGDMVTYTVTVTNNGPSTAATPTVSYRPERGLSDVLYSIDGGKTWKIWTGIAAIPDILNGGFQQIHIRGKIDGAATGSIFAFASAASRTNDPNPANNTAAVQISASPRPICTVRFCIDNCMVERKSVPCDTPVQAPAPPCRPGCTFGGWYTDLYYSCMWRFNEPVAGDMALHAKFIPD